MYSEIALNGCPALSPAPFVIFRNSGLVQAALKKGKDKKDAKNFAYKTLLPDYIPQSINI